MGLLFVVGWARVRRVVVVCMFHVCLDLFVLGRVGKYFFFKSVCCSLCCHVV